MALTVISGINHEGKNIVLGFALVKKETMETYKWIISNLLRFNNGVEPGAILTDFDASMCGAIEQTFEKSTHLLCQWHMQQNLKKHFLYLKRVHQNHAKLLYKYIVYDLLYEESQQLFETYVNIIFQSQDIIGEAKLNYLRNLLMIKEKWSAAYAPTVFTSRTHTTSRIESMNSQIKARVHSRSTLVDIFHMFQDIEDRVVERSECEQRNEMKLVLNHPFLSEVYELYT
jgi:transposase-like protein